MMRHLVSKKIDLIGIVIFFVMMAILNRLLIKVSEGQNFVPPEKREKINSLLYKTLSFGHLPVAIDWSFITALTDSALERVNKGDHPALYYSFDLITELDPAHFDAIQSGAYLLSVIRGDSLGARDLLLKGSHFIKTELPHLPEDFKNRFWQRSWNLFMILGFIELFQLDDLPHAAEAFRESANYPGAPDFILKLEKRLSRPGGEYEVGLRLLNFMMNGTNDDRVKKELERKRLNLFISQYVFELNHSFQNFLDSQPKYRSNHHLTFEQMSLFWKNFSKSARISAMDPWGGKIQLDSNGKVVTSTPHEVVFGLH